MCGTFITTQVFEHVAAELGLNAAKVKQRNFIGLPENAQPDPLAPPCTDMQGSTTSGSAAAAQGDSPPAAAADGQAGSSASGRAFSMAADGTPEVADTMPEAADSMLEAAEPAAGFPPRPCFAGPAEGLANGEQVASAPQPHRWAKLPRCSWPVQTTITETQQSSPGASGQLRHRICLPVEQASPFDEE